MSDTEPARPSTLVERSRRWRYLTLLAAMLLIFLYAPFVQLFATHLQPTVARFTLASLFIIQLLSAVFSISKDTKSLFVAIGLVAPALLSQVYSTVEDGTTSVVVSQAFSGAFLAYVVVMLLRAVFGSREVTADTIIAALSIFLLLGVLWAIGYSMLETLSPGSFVYSLATTRGEVIALNSPLEGLSIYFSFVTMTTLGFGDIVPVTPAARALTTLQAVFGQFYLTVLVARLVGLHVAASARS